MKQLNNANGQGECQTSRNGSNTNKGMETSATTRWLPRVRGLAGQSREIARRLDGVEPHSSPHCSLVPTIRFASASTTADGEFDRLVVTFRRSNGMEQQHADTINGTVLAVSPEVNKQLPTAPHYLLSPFCPALLPTGTLLKSQPGPDCQFGFAMFADKLTITSGAGVSVVGCVAAAISVSASAAATSTDLSYLLTVVTACFPDFV